VSPLLDLGVRRFEPDPAVAGTTFGVTLQRLTQQAPDALAVSCGTESLTRAELFARAYDLALRLVDAGVRHGDYVSTVMHNSCDAVVGVFATWFAGAVPQVLSPKLAARELQEILELTAPAAVLGLTDPDVVGARPAFAAPFLTEPAASGVLPDLAAPAWKAPTSGGSTGRPKVIVAGQPALMESIALGDIFRIPTAGSVLVTAPLSHNAPFCAGALAILRGCHTVLMPRFDATETLRLIDEHDISWVYAVPTMMARIWKLPADVRDAFDVTSVRVWLHMAAACAPALKEAFIGWLGPDVVWELYGGTEAQSVTLLDGNEWLAHRGSVGKPVSGAMEVRDDTGAVVPAGTVGRIWLRADPGAPETYRYLGAVAQSDGAGWETLGDLGYVDDDGFVYLADRDSDMFTVGGVNVYPAEIEAALLEHEAVLDACVIGLPDEELGAVPHAIVQTRDAATVDDLVTWLTDRLAPHKRPKSVEYAGEALRDDAGKVRRAQLRRDRLGLGAPA
jgi:bile acid-coenzyme A ligase